jgi:4-amino-4-deoxy-L-arabinose transferase-like glycosyltransferase
VFSPIYLPKTRIPLWLPLWLGVALLAIFQHGPMPLYSTRTLAVAWEMWQHGEWLVPHINGAPYSHKVPLLFWLIHAGWAVGGVGDVWPRILEVLIGAGWLLAAAALARRVFARRAEVAAIVPWLLLALSYAFLFGLQIMYEMLLAFWVAAALCCLVGRPRWIAFALCVGAGLLTKGPVMLLHVAFPLLLGPWWSEAARADRRGWYVRGAMALGGGFALLVAWALPAGFAGGQAYRNELFFMQTAGRVVDSFDHARPLWWYLPMLPVLLFPWIAWPRLWAAAWRWREPLGDGERFLIAWLVPTLGVFSLVSGKQVYYLLPLLPGAAMLLARLVSRSEWNRGARPLLGGWPLGIAVVVAGVFLLALPWLVQQGKVQSVWLVDAADGSALFGAVFVVLGLWLAVPRRDAAVELRRIAFATLLGTAAAHALFARTLWHYFDLTPASHVMREAQLAGRPLANLGTYEGQFQFLARLTQPITEVHTPDLAAWLQAHPNALVATYTSRLTPVDLRHARLIQPFRSRWLLLWDAPVLAALRAGATPPDSAHPTTLAPPDYWRYRQVEPGSTQRIEDEEAP